MKDLFPEKVAFFMSGKKDGPMNFVGHEFYDQERRANRAAFLSTIGFKATDTVVPRLMQGGNVEVVDKPNPTWGSILADAVITGRKGLALTVSAGDCPPVALYDPINEVIALIHAGWRPLVAGIVEKTIEKMRLELGCHAQNILAYIGPGICGTCYEVGEEVWTALGHTPGVSPGGGKYNISLSDEIDIRLRAVDVSKMNIMGTTDCTKHSEDGARYFSWRGDRSDPLMCNMAVFVMR